MSCTQSPEQLEKERNDSKWETSKVRRNCRLRPHLMCQVREELCLVHEAYQFFRNKYKARYGNHNPPHPDLFKNKKDCVKGQKNI